jgi:hypothetical protein
MDTDKRRYGVIEVRQLNDRTYWLEISGVMWSEVEWSRERQRWCIQDAAGHCLTHVEHIVGQDKDPQTAIRLAKKMIVDGRMPSPEQARAQLKAEQEAERNPAPEPADLGELFTMEGIPEPEPVAVRRRR